MIVVGMSARHRLFWEVLLIHWGQDGEWSTTYPDLARTMLAVGDQLLNVEELLRDCLALLSRDEATRGERVGLMERILVLLAPDSLARPP